MEDDLPQKYAALQEEVAQLKKLLWFYGETAAIAFLKTSYTKKTLIKLNYSLEVSESLKRIFASAQISHMMNMPNDPPQRLYITFGTGVAYADLYAVARITKAYGFESILFRKKDYNIIDIGSCIAEPSFAMSVDAQSINNGIILDDFINGPYLFTTERLIETHFSRFIRTKKKPVEEEPHFENDSNDDSDGYSGHSVKNEYARDNFDALTDGQEGDYDDFNGDWDSLNDRAGR